MTQDKLVKNLKFNRRDILKYLGVSAAATITPELASRVALRLLKPSEQMSLLSALGLLV